MGIENAFDRVSHDTLLRLDENGNLAPYLATAWNIDPVSNTITLTLSKGVKFHDGTDFNAQAVKWSLDLRKNEYKNTVYNTVKSIDVLDDYTVRINLATFDNTFLPALWFIPSQISSPTDYQKLGKDKAAFTMVGTGPFIMTEFNQDAGFKFARNPNYWQPGKPYLDAFEYRVIADPTTQELLFRKGGIDVPPIDSDIQQRLKDTGLFQFIPSTGTAPASFTDLVPDSANPDSPWSNLKVRQAAEYAIDKNAIAAKMGGPSAVAQYQWGPAGTYAYIPDLPARKYDPAKAKQLLTEAGYPNGFKTTAFVGSTIQASRDTELAVHEYWRQVGIDITYNQLTLASFLEKSKTGWKNGIMDGVPRIVPDWLSGAYGNWSTASAGATMASKLRTPEMDALLAKAISTPDLVQRNKLAQDINRYISDNCLSIQIYTGGGIGGGLYQTNIRGVGPRINVWSATGTQLWGSADIWKSNK
jgi:peptide/nickel transport system substrate-binding protein